MKKLLIICILIISIVFISGCTNNEKTNSETSIDTPSNQKSDAQTPDLIIKSSDVPELTLNSHTFYSVPKNTLYIPSNDGGRGSSNTLNHYADKYTDTLRLGHQNVGEESQWYDQSGKQVHISVAKYDSDPNSSLIKMITLDKQYYQMISENNGDPHIGDHSFYVAYIDPDTDIQVTQLSLIHDTTYVWISVVDEEGISKETAIRIAKIIDSRLD